MSFYKKVKKILKIIKEIFESCKSDCCGDESVTHIHTTIINNSTVEGNIPVEGEVVDKEN